VSAKLAEILHAQPGDLLQVEVLDGKRPSFAVPLHALITDYAGLSAYMNEFELQRLLKEGRSLSGTHFSIDPNRWREFFETVKNTPAITTLRIKEATRQSFRKTTAESINLLQLLYFTFAVVVSFGVVYNSARISLSERTRDLATLRVLGFTGSEVALILLGELLLLTLIALPSGMLLGSGMTAVIIKSVNTESVRLPLVLTSKTFTTAAIIALTSTGLSFSLIYRRIRELDLLAVLKAAE
jgi:putative ABC transport system permease protein